MRYRLIDLLACPHDKHWPLKLVVVEKETQEDMPIPKFIKENELACEEFCGREELFLNDATTKKLLSSAVHPCISCYKDEIITGILICDECNRWFPIRETIPELLPDELRDKKQEEKFIDEISPKLSPDVLKLIKKHEE